MTKDAATNSDNPSPGVATTVLPEVKPATPEASRAGSLTYTSAGLFALFAWLLFFDFCFTLMEAELGPIIQFRLMNDLKMDAWWYMVVLSTIPACINFVLNPIISIKSDRFRSRFGRRIPFLLVGAPPTCALLAMIGFGNEIGAWVHSTFTPSTSLVTVTIWTFSLLSLLFTVSNMMLATTFYYLFNDVVPRQHLVKFMAYFRATGVVAGMVYAKYIFPYSDKSGPLHIDLGFWSYHTDHIWYPKLILVGAAVFYVIAATIALLNIKEPEYPPPPPLAKGQGVVERTISTIGTVVRECFCHRFYVLFFVANIVEWAGMQMGNFVSPARKAMGMDFFVLGNWGFYIGLVSLLLTIATANWGDRWRPMPLYVAAGTMVLLKGTIQLLFLIPGLSSETYLNIQLTFNVVGVPLAVLYGMAQAPLAMSLLPRDRYGQFAAANAMMRMVSGQIVGGQIAGLLMRWLQHHYDPGYALRYAFLWSFIFQACALFCFYLLYREWKKLGGREGFEPPPVRPGESSGNPVVK